MDTPPKTRSSCPGGEARLVAPPTPHLTEFERLNAWNPALAARFEGAHASALTVERGALPEALPRVHATAARTRKSLMIPPCGPARP